MDNEIEICATGNEFITEGIRYIVPVTREILSNAEREILITVYSFGKFDKKIKNILIEKVTAGKKLILIVNKYSKQDLRPSFIEEMNSEFSNLEVYDFDSGSKEIDLHAKIIGVDNNTAVIGSSNLSKRGHVSNYEMGVILKGEAAARIIRGCYSLINSDKVKLVR